jgi:hypothetical protein
MLYAERGAKPDRCDGRVSELSGQHAKSGL